MSLVITRISNKLNSIVIVSSLILASSQAIAGAFALHEQSITYLGTAYAGTASTAEDASSVYYNPAALSELENAQAVLSAAYFKARTELYNATARTNAGIAVQANPTTYPASNAVIPGLHLGARINKDWAIGFGVNAPFGLNTRYSNTSIARYMGTISKLESLNLTPGFSYRVNNKFSIGAGFDAMHLKANISSAVNATGTEGYSNNYGSGWTYGYHIGVFYKPSADTKMGLVYYSIFNPRVSGHVDAAAYPPTTPIPTTLTSDMKLPDRLVYSITHQYNYNWSAMGEVEWTHWSRLSELRINYNTGRSATELLYYKNAFRFAFGVNYKLNDPWLFKAGAAFDQTPVNAPYRTARLPDSNRTWLALGVKYKMNKNIWFDVGYAHLFFNKCTIQQVGVAPDNRKTLSGNYKNSADLVGVQLTWNFV